ncbi:MAG: ATP-dependent DNA helicase RecQ [Acidobacteriota bacterium]
MSTGPDAPADLEAAREVLRRHFGHDDFRPGQDEAVERVLSGEDFIIVMPTGAGKSACYQVPALLRSGLTLVVSPLIALMKDQVEALQARGLPAELVNSTQSAAEQRRHLEAAANGELRMLYVAPERLGAPSFLQAMERAELSFLAIDEAHCVSQWGHDFRPAYGNGLRRFLEQRREQGFRGQVVALTATATERVRRDVSDVLGLDPDRALVTGFRRDNLRLLSRRRDRRRDRLDQVLQVVQGVGGSGIVYCARRKDVEEVTGELIGEGLSAVGYHAGLPDEERSRVQDQFLSGQVPIIAATNAFGMGIDKPDIRFVVHHSLPGSIEAYYQEAGRAGRDGKTSYCVLVHGNSDPHLHRFFLEVSCPPDDAVHDTWLGLKRLNEDELDRSVADIASLCGVPEHQCGGALRILQDARLIARTDGPGRRRSLQVLEAELPQRDVAERLAPLLERMEARRERGEERLDRIVHYAHCRQCRHGFLLSYFGDRSLRECPACDNCRGWKDEGPSPSSSRRRSSGSRRKSGGGGLTDDNLDLARRAALQAATMLHGRFGVGVLALVLRGSRSKKVLGSGLDEAPAYGELSRLSADQVRGVIDGLLNEGLIEQSGGPYPVLLLSEDGRLQAER